MTVTSLLQGHSRRRRIDLMRMSTALRLVVLLALAVGVPQCSCLFGSPAGNNNAETEDLAPQNEFAGKLPSQNLHALLHLDTRSIIK